MRERDRQREEKGKVCILLRGVMGSGFSINAVVMTALQCHLLALKLH